MFQVKRGKGWHTQTAGGPDRPRRFEKSMPLSGGMVFDARPFKPDRNDRKPHPLGPPVNARPPWLPTPPSASSRPPPGPSHAESAAMMAAGRPLPRNETPRRPKPPPPAVPAPRQPAVNPPAVAAQPTPMTGPSASSFLPPEPPSIDDLFALYRLCGGNESRCIDLLARLWDAPRDAIAPTVRQWLSGLPSVAPPSRSRSAPPMLPAWLAGADAVLASGKLGPIPTAAAPIAVAPCRPPPISAPARPNVLDRKGPNTASKDVLALHRAVQQHAAKLGNTHARQVLALQPVSEDAPVTNFWTPAAYGEHGSGAEGPPMDADALEAFMYKARMSGKLGAVDRGRGMTSHMR